MIAGINTVAIQYERLKQKEDMFSNFLIEKSSAEMYLFCEFEGSHLWGPLITSGKNDSLFPCLSIGRRQYEFRINNRASFAWLVVSRYRHGTLERGKGGDSCQ